MRRLDPEESYSDALERLLDETLDAVPLEALIGTYREQADASYVGVQTVRPGWDRELPLSIHVPEPGETPLPIVDSEAVRVDDTPYPFSVAERPADTGTESMLTLFADSDGEQVAVAEGIERLQQALAGVEATLPDAVERAREAGVRGLAVADEPVGTGVHLLWILSPETEAGSFVSPDRLVLDDRTLMVGRVTTLSAAEHETEEGTTLLWAAPTRVSTGRENSRRIRSSGASGSRTRCSGPGRRGPPTPTGRRSVEGASTGRSGRQHGEHVAARGPPRRGSGRTRQAGTG